VVKPRQIWLERLRRVPLRWRIAGAVAGIAAAAVAAAAIGPLHDTVQDTRYRPQWRSADTYDADVLEVFAVLEANTGVGGRGRDGLRLYVEAGGLYWLALDIAPDGRGRGTFFGLEYADKLESPEAIGPRVFTLSPAEAAAFAERFDDRLEYFWGLDTPRDMLVDRAGPLMMWERRRDGTLFSGWSVALPGNTYSAVSRDVRALLARHLPRREVPDSAWSWPGGA
jgi:hypothetical protein